MSIHIIKKNTKIELKAYLARYILFLTAMWGLLNFSLKIKVMFFLTRSVQSNHAFGIQTYIENGLLLLLGFLPTLPEGLTCPSGCCPTAEAKAVPPRRLAPRPHHGLRLRARVHLLRPHSPRRRSHRHGGQN